MHTTQIDPLLVECKLFDKNCWWTIWHMFGTHLAKSRLAVRWHTLSPWTGEVHLKCHLINAVSAQSNAMQKITNAHIKILNSVYYCEIQGNKHKCASGIIVQVNSIDRSGKQTHHMAQSTSGKWYATQTENTTCTQSKTPPQVGNIHRGSETAS